MKPKKVNKRVSRGWPVFVPKSFKVEERKFPTKKGRTTWGRCMANGAIELNIKLTPLNRITTLVHECLHRQCPWMDELAVEAAGEMIADTLWDQGYRRVSQ